MSTEVAGVQASTASSSTDSSSSKSNLSVDTETFLQLLVAQLQYQDPMDPQSDTDFVTQLAQMSSLEEMQQLNTSFSSVQAYSLVGKLAYAESTDGTTGETNYYYGSIDSIVNSSGNYYAAIGDNVVAISDIVQIFDSDILSGGSTIVESSNLIGKTISGTYTDESDSTQEITGTVTSVAAENGIVFAYIDDIAVAVANITGISSQTN